MSEPESVPEAPAGALASASGLFGCFKELDGFDALPTGEQARAADGGTATPAEPAAGGGPAALQPVQEEWVEVPSLQTPPRVAAGPPAMIRQVSSGRPKPHRTPRTGRTDSAHTRTDRKLFQDERKMKKRGDKQTSKFDEKLQDFADDRKLYRVEFSNASKKVRLHLTKTAQALGLQVDEVERGTPQMIYDQFQAVGLDLPKPGDLHMSKEERRSQIVDLVVSRPVPPHRNSITGRICTAVWCALMYALAFIPDGAIWLLVVVGFWLAPNMTCSVFGLQFLQFLLGYVPEIVTEAWWVRVGHAASFVCSHVPATVQGILHPSFGLFFPTAMAVGITATVLAVILLWLAAPTLLFISAVLGVWCLYNTMPGPWKRTVTGAAGIAFAVLQAVPLLISAICKMEPVTWVFFPGTLYGAWCKFEKVVSLPIAVAFRRNWKKSIDEWLYYVELAFEKESSGADTPFADVQAMVRDRDFAAYDDRVDVLCVNIDWMANSKTYAIRYKHMRTLSMKSDLPELAEAIWDAKWLLPPSGLQTESQQDKDKDQLLLHLELGGGSGGSSSLEPIIAPIVGAITEPSRCAKLHFAHCGKDTITDVPVSFSVMLPLDRKRGGPSGAEGRTPGRKRKCRVLVADTAAIMQLSDDYHGRAGRAPKNCWDGKPDYGGNDHEGRRGDQSGAEGDFKFDVWCALLQMARFADDTELRNSVVFRCCTTTQ
jgi:hypothetical protein